MQYRIIEQPPYCSSLIRVGLELEPDNEPVKYLLASFGLKYLQKLIASANEEVGRGIEDHSISYYGDLDGSDFADGVGFEPDEVGFWVYSIGFGILKKDLFFHMLCDYTDAVLAYYKGSPEMTEEMEADIRRELGVLKKKIGKE